MKAVVVYESMYGNTHLVADAIGQGLSALYDVDVVPIDRVDPRLLDGADLIVVGGPTHAHGMSRSSTREAAVEQARKPDSDLTLDSDAEGPGLRDWFDSLQDYRPGGSVRHASRYARGADWACLQGHPPKASPARAAAGGRAGELPGHQGQ